MTKSAVFTNKGAEYSVREFCKGQSGGVVWAPPFGHPGMYATSAALLRRSSTAGNRLCGSFTVWKLRVRRRI